MKKVISILLLIVMIFSLSACNKSNNTSSELDAGVQSDISSIGDSTENTTTSEEISTSTSSTNTTTSNTIPSNSTPSNSTPSNSTPSNSTPSNSTPSNSTPSNSTPSKTEKTKKESISIIGEWLLVRNRNDGKIVFYDNMTCDYLGSKNLKYDFSNNTITIYTNWTNVLYVDKGEYIRLHTPQNDIEYVREENYDKVHKKFWNEKLTAITKERKELFLGDEFSIATGVTAKIKKIYIENIDKENCQMPCIVFDITNITGKNIHLADIDCIFAVFPGETPTGRNSEIRHGNLFHEGVVASKSTNTIKTYIGDYHDYVDMFSALEWTTNRFAEPILPLLIGENYFINLTHEMFKN